MSRNARPPSKRTDRRVVRTRDRLGDAIVSLVQEKPFEAITVQEVLDRAQVGRSTFYAHFRDKDDLFLSDADEFLETMAMELSRADDPSDRVAPVRELFAHVGEQRRLYAALVESGKVHDFLDLAREHFARGIERRLAERPRSRGIPKEKRGALAQGCAGALLSLLTWWLDQRKPASPEAMDDLYHRMIWTGVGEPEAGWKKSG